MKWQSQYPSAGPSSINQTYGGYSEAYDPLASIQFAENSQLFQTRYPYPVIGAFGRGWDDLQYMSDEFVTVAQQNTTANRRIIVSNQEDFFRDFEANYGSGLETHAAAYGNEWDALVASLAEVSARVKRATEKLRTADALAALVSVNNPNFMTPRIADRDRAMLDLGLYFEHDWTADGAISRTRRADWSRRVEGEITAYVDKLETDARAELGRQISRDGTAQRFFVFNPLSWTRTDFADLPLRANWRAKVFDVSTGAEVPSQLMRVGTSPISARRGGKCAVGRL